MRTFSLSFVLLLLTIGFVGCSENSSLVGTDSNDRLTQANQQAIRSVQGSLSVFYAEDTGRQLRASRKITATITFRVMEIDAATHTARGTFELRDDIGNRYYSEVEHIDFKDDGSVSFWGPLAIDVDHATADNWLFVSVQDGRPDALTFQFGSPAPGPDTNLPDEAGTEVTIERGDIVIEGTRMHAKRLN